MSIKMKNNNSINTTVKNGKMENKRFWFHGICRCHDDFPKSL